VDSALDLLSTAIIYFTAVAAGAKETKTRVSLLSSLQISVGVSKRAACDSFPLRRSLTIVPPTSQYPTGKKRFEPLGVLIFSVIMIASFSQVRSSPLSLPLSFQARRSFFFLSFLQVFIEAVQRLMDKNPSKEAAALSLFGKATMVMTIVVKGLVWWWCSNERSSGVQA